MRDAQPKLVNTDKHPLCLIKATVAVDDLAGVTARLAEHAEFDVDGDTITWWGRELDALERETSVAEVHAMLRHGAQRRLATPRARAECGHFTPAAVTSARRCRI